MIKLFKKMNKKSYVFMFISFVMILGQVYFDLKLPDYMSNITKLVQTEGSAMSEILTQGGYMMLCAFASLALAIITGYLMSYISASLSMGIKESLYNRVDEFGTSEMKKFSVSSLITRTTNDVSQIQMFASMGLQILVKSPITAVWAVFKILNKGLEWSVLTAVVVAILFILIATLIIKVMPKFKVIQKLTDNLNNITRESLTGIRVVKSFNAEDYQEEKFNRANVELTDNQLYTQKKLSILSPTLQTSMSLLTLGIYVIGAILINNAGMLDRIDIFSNMVVFSSYSMQVIMSLMSMVMIFMILPRANVSAKRIIEVLETDPSIKEGTFDGKTKETGTVEFKNVTFKYPDAEASLLENINFKVSKGETIAFIGSTGSGKSTLINLIPRFYDVTEGEVLVDGVNVKDYKFECLNNKIGYISQKAVMFNGTVDYNISYGKSEKEISNNKIEEALAVSEASGFVEKMPEKRNSHIASGGTNISGGQKQRLSIARAVAREPEIYIFDDSFSALDYKTDYEVRKNLKKYTKDATLLIVAQRIGTIKNADLIIVLDDGKIVGAGKHNELLKKCKVYKEIALSQLSKEELENV